MEDRRKKKKKIRVSVKKKAGSRTQTGEKGKKSKEWIVRSPRGRGRSPGETANMGESGEKGRKRRRRIRGGED